jgi:outer membrane murein-binding lipoprotein Lpp
MKRWNRTLMVLSASVMLCGCAQNAKETELQTFIESHVDKIKPLEQQANLAWWDAAVTGAAPHI